MKFVLVLVLALMLTGCALNADRAAGLAKVIDALAKDPATVCFTATFSDGTVAFSRTNITQGDVECDRLKVKSTGTTTVPVKVEAVK